MSEGRSHKGRAGLGANQLRVRIVYYRFKAPVALPLPRSNRPHCAHPAISPKKAGGIDARVKVRPSSGGRKIEGGLDAALVRVSLASPSRVRRIVCVQAPVAKVHWIASTSNADQKARGV